MSISETLHLNHVKRVIKMGKVSLMDWIIDDK